MTDMERLKMIWDLLDAFDEEGPRSYGPGRLIMDLEDALDWTPGRENPYDHC